MKRSALIFSLLIGTLLLCSCTAEIDILEDSFRSSHAELSGGGQNIQILFDSNAGTASIELKANMKWEASFLNDRASWCTLSSESGKRGTVALTISVSENSSYDERSASIVFKCKDSQQNIVVVQKQRDAVILSSSKLEVPESGGVFNLEVRHNVNYDVDIDNAAQSWIHFTGTKALATSVISLRVDANEEFASRSGKIFIRSDLGEETVMVYQEAATPQIVLTQKEYTVSDAGGQIVVEIKSNVNYEYSIEKDATWLSEIKTKSMSTHTLHFTASANETYDGRSGKIRFEDKEHGLVEEVTVYQKQKDALLLSQNEYDVSDEGAIVTIEVKSNVEFGFEILEGSEWITSIGTKALTTHTLQFEIAANDSYDDRVGKIYFSDKNTGLSEVVTVKQKQKDALLLKQSEYRVSDNGEIISVEINSNVEFSYDITEGSDWISLIQTKGLSSHVLQFAISQNLSCLGRQGKIVFKDAVSGQTASVVIVQEESTYEKEILMSIYDACTNESWKRWHSWSMNSQIQNWAGIELNDEGRVESIDLGQRYSGTIPPSIGGLSELKTFRIEYGSLTSFPGELCKCAKLEEIILTGFNAPCFYGTLPSSLKDLKNLRKIDLCNNALTSFPIELCECANLEDINLSSGRMEGPLPNEIGALKNLSFLDLSGNRNLKGKIPSSLFLLPCWKCCPFDILLGTGLECDLSDFIAPDFDIQDVDGNRIVSSKLYSDNKYTILYIAACYNPDAVLLESFNNLAKEHPQSIGLVFFFNDETESVLSYREEQSIHWPCVNVTEDMVISGQTGNRNLYSRSASYTGTLFVVNQKGDIVYGSGGPIRNRSKDSIYDYLTRELGREEGYYQSSDYSLDGEVVVLQKAREGKGIDLVFMGDGYSDRFITDGTYIDDMNKGMEAFFSEEPYKSYRHLFNVYSIVAVSKNDFYDLDYGTETAFKIDVTGASGLRCNDLTKVRDYARKALDNNNERMMHSVITTVVRSETGRSVCYIGTPFLGSPSEAFCVKRNGDYLATVVSHETGGHGFGGLADEYEDEGLNMDLQSLYDNILKHHDRWQYMNIDITNNPASIIWSKFLARAEYTETVGIFEGGWYHSKGVYRPSEESMMRHNTPGFNAPSREAIYYRIHKMAYGDEWVYDFNDFLEYDKINLNTLAPAPLRINTVKETEKIDIRDLTAPPIVK